MYSEGCSRELIEWNDDDVLLCAVIDRLSGSTTPLLWRQSARVPPRVLPDPTPRHGSDPRSVRHQVPRIRALGHGAARRLHVGSARADQPSDGLLGRIDHLRQFGGRGQRSAPLPRRSYEDATRTARRHQRSAAARGQCHRLPQQKRPKVSTRHDTRRKHSRWRLPVCRLVVTAITVVSPHLLNSTFETPPSVEKGKPADLSTLKAA